MTSSILPLAFYLIWPVFLVGLFTRYTKYTKHRAEQALQYSSGTAYALTWMVENPKNEDRLLRRHGTYTPFDYGVRAGVQMYKDEIKYFWEDR
jgi:hypothetical protein